MHAKSESGDKYKPAKTRAHDDLSRHYQMCSAQLYARGGGSYARHPKTICRANSILARAADDGANRIEGKPPRLQKAHLPGPLLASLGSDPELSAPDFARALGLGRAGGAGCLLGEFLVEALRAQFVRDARRPVLARQRVSARFRVTLLRQELPPQEVFQQRLEIVFWPDVRRELAHQLGAAVLPPREQPQGPLAQRRLLFHTSAVTGANASGFLTPSFSRIFASISAASSGFSLRKSRALSLPCPMRSFLYWYQAPDLSTTPQPTPSSRISPSSDTPSP